MRHQQPCSLMTHHLVSNCPIDLERVCRCVVGALMSKRPHTRYALVAQRFKNWTLPMWLPERWMDTLMAQAFLKK